MSKKERASQVFDILQECYPDAKIALNFEDKFQLLVAVVLSAQCTDERVNMVTPKLFEVYPSIEAFAGAKQEDLEKLIYSTGFFRNKAKNIIGAAKKIVEDFEGEVPGTMEQLLTIPGVARKTANVILSSGFGKNEGVTVDTHVIRISGLLGFVPKKLSKSKNAVKIEQELMKLFPRDRWGKLSHLLIFHGRQKCIARRPKCEECRLNELCPSAFKAQR